MSGAPTNGLLERAMAALRRKGNPFRQQFARNADDPVCSLYHVDSLFASKRRLLCDLVESYRGVPQRPSCVVPILGARGAGKTHLLHWLKHGPSDQPHLFVTPGTFRIDAAAPDATFLEYVLYQLINVLLSGEHQRGLRPLYWIADRITRRVLVELIQTQDAATPRQWALRPRSWWSRIAHRLGLDKASSLARAEIEKSLRNASEPCRRLVERLEWDPHALIESSVRHLEAREAHDLGAAFRKRIVGGLLRAMLTGDENELADFLTDGFADPPGHVRPARGQLILSLLRALCEVLVGAGITVTVAFDQLEELLYGQTEPDVRRACDAFFGGIVHLMSQSPGLCVLLFVEEGLWNRIVPPLPSHILDRIHEPIHVPGHGTVRNIRLSTPTAHELTEVVRRRIETTLAEFPQVSSLPPAFPFSSGFLEQLASRETVLRLMLQGCCNRLDEMFERGIVPEMIATEPSAHDVSSIAAAPQPDSPSGAGGATEATADPTRSWSDLIDRWFQEVRAAERKLKPVGSLAAATAELHGGLTCWLKLCNSLGVVHGDWRMASIHETLAVGEHPSYGTLTIIEWCHRDGRSQRLAVGLWLGRGVGKPRDLATKLQALDGDRNIAEHLVLFRPDDDLRLSGKSQVVWNDAVTQGKNVRLEPITVDELGRLYGFPRWIQQVHDLFADGRVPEAAYRFLATQTESIMLKLRLPVAPADVADAA